MDSTLWLQTENKVRALIKDLLEPTVRRATDTIKQVEKLAKTQNSVVFKLEDVDLAVVNLEKRLANLDEYSKKIMEFEGNQIIMESRFNRERDDIRMEVLRFSQQQTSFQDNLEVLQHQKDSLREDVTLAQHAIVSTKYELEAKFSVLQSKYEEIMVKMDNRLSVLDTANFTVKKNIERIINEITGLDAQVKDSLRIATQATKDFKQLRKNVKKNTEEHEKEINKTNAVCLNISTDVQRAFKEVKTLDKAFKTDETWIKHDINKTDPFYIILKDLQTLKLLAGYDKERLEKIDMSKYSENTRRLITLLIQKSEEIINTPIPEPPVLKKRAPSSTSSKKKRKKDQRKQIKKKIAHNIQTSNTLPRGQTVNLDSQLAKFQMLPSPEFLTDPDLPRPFALGRPFSKASSRTMLKDDPDNPKVPNSFPAEIPFTNKDLPVVSFPSINSSDSEDSDSISFIDFSPLIEQVRTDLQQQSHFLYLELKSSIEFNAQGLSTKLEETKQEFLKKVSHVTSMHDNFTASVEKKLGEIELAIQQAIYECNASSLARKRDHNDKENQYKTITSALDDVISREGTIHESVEHLSSSFDRLVEYCRISMALQSQDEVDRESIALMGYKKTKNTVVTLDRRCLSCAGQSSAVLGAFKMACLAYEPSAVVFQNKRFTRKELLKVQNGLLVEFVRRMDNEMSEESREIYNETRDMLNETREMHKTMLINKNWRPLSVPPSRFSTLSSPHGKSPENEILPMLRRSLKTRND